jgi:hypothetical protein
LLGPVDCGSGFANRRHSVSGLTAGRILFSNPIRLFASAT